jgi:hypothetical protein
MNIQDLPLPLRLRNALRRSDLKTDEDVREWLDSHAPDFHDIGIPGVGATGVAQLVAWYQSTTTAPTQEPAVVEAETPEESIAKGAKRHEVSALLDTAMRGGLERLDARRSDEDAARIRRRQFDAAFEKEVSRGMAMMGTGSFGDMAAMFHASGGSVDVRSGKNAKKLLALDLETDIQARVTALIPTIKALPHVKELGVEVSAETVGRMALIRGLDALERAHGAKNQAEKPAETAKTAENREPTLPTGDEEVFETPEGWTKCGPTDKIPVPEAVLHDYYTQNGWFRYWGMVDGQPIYFYWCPERRLQELGIFPGTDKSGRKVAVQETPWGPGHVVPAKWTNS